MSTTVQPALSQSVSSASVAMASGRGVLRPMRWVRSPILRRYGFAIFVGATAVALKLALSPLLTRDEPVLLFLGATLLAATLGGLGPGLCVTAIGALADEYFFMAPYGNWHLNSPDQLLRLFFFVAEGVVISVICDRTRSARKAAETSAAAAQDLQQHVTEIADHERRRLGQDLHDGLGQQLTGIALLTRRLQERLCAVGAAESADAVALTAMVRETLCFAHDLCGTLDPAMSDPLGVPKALADLTRKASGLLGVKCTFEQIGVAPIASPESAVHLYRITQEAISNAARHGRAKSVLVRLEQTKDLLRLQITDDGIGLSAPAGKDGDGMGLRIMKYRAQMLGGAITIEPRADAAGTLVECRVPLSTDAATMRLTELLHG